MKKIIAIFILLTYVSCQTETDSNTVYSKGNYSIRIIDGCEYIQVENAYKSSNNYNYTLTHKGNCSNPIHKCPCQNQSK